MPVSKTRLAALSGSRVCRAVGVVAIVYSTWTPAARADASSLSLATSKTVADAVVQTNLSPNEFLESFAEAVLDGLGDLGPRPRITGNAEADARIAEVAEARGYQRQPLPNRPLAAVGNHWLQPEAAAAWESLQTAARKAGFDIRIRSAHRGHAAQRYVFGKHYAGVSAAALNRTLSLVAPPGYSRHHTGYAIDISEGTGDFNYFGNTASYRWLTANNFANAKSHGWVPSYPTNSRPAGPNPEPWEFVWVGVTNIVCADRDFTPEGRFCDTLGSIFSAEIDWLHAEGITNGCRPNRFCGDGLLTRAQGATLLWRYARMPEATSDIPFLDVPTDSYYLRPTQWMFSQNLTTGTSETTFDPNRPISKAEFVTFLWRLALRPEPINSDPLFSDVSSLSFAAKAIAWAVETGITTLAKLDQDGAIQDTGLPSFFPAATITREQAAAFLHRFAMYHTPTGDQTPTDEDT